ncbi:MAG: hypothetical protein V2A54_07730 [Bacteroidota bacterium]
MIIKRNILKFRSGFYYYSLVLLGLTGILFLSRCNNPEQKKDNQQSINDSLAKIKQDSLKADSIAKVKHQLVLDSIAKADSIRKADSLKKVQKPVIRPVNTAKKYGVRPSDYPMTEYGIPPNNYEKKN